MFTFPVTHFGAGEAGAFPSSICFDLDATQDESTDTTDEWKNLIASPNDGSAQADYDFFLGTSGAADSAQPTLTGSGPARHFSHDGGDFFTHKGASGTMFDDMHFTTGGAGAVWLAFAFQAVIDVNAALIGNSGGGDQGMRFTYGTNESIRFLQRGDTDSFIDGITADDVVAAEDALIIVTFDTTNPGSEQIWYKITTGAAWTNSYSPNATTTTAPRVMRIASSDAAGTPNQIVPNLTRFYAASGGNSILTDAEAAGIFSLYAGRHNRNYLV